MTKKTKPGAAKKPDWVDPESSWEFDAEDMGVVDDEDSSMDDLAEWRLLSADGRRLQARRAIEFAREELALRRALEDFPYDY